jgi:integrase
METLRAVYNSAIKRRLAPGIPPVSPTSMVDWNIEARRNTGMSPDELQVWAQQLLKLSNPVRREFHLFTLLSAMRPDALKKARWEHIDLKRRMLHVPKPKGGERRAFDLPLSREMIRCLCRVRRAGRLYGQRADEWIFPSETPEGHISHHKERRHILSHWGGDLRQTWRGMAVLAGLDELPIQILMNHALGGVSAGYLTVAALRDHLL